MTRQRNPAPKSKATGYLEDFYALQKQIFDFYNLGRFREALSLAEKAAIRFPGKDDRTTYWKACLHSRLGERDEALQILNKATRRGLWWSEEALTQEKDLDPLREMAEFKLFLAECARLKQEVGTNVKSELAVLTPPDYSADEVYPLMIVLHPRGEDLDYEFLLWKPALSKNVIVAFPRSSQILTSHSRCWDDLARSESEITKLVSQLMSSYKTDQDKVILAGFSQGATLAIYLALHGNLPVRRFVAVAPASTVTPSHSKEFAVFVKSSKARGLKGWFLVGDKDRFFESTKVLHSSLEQNGLRSEFIVQSGLGHFYPDNFAIRLNHAIDFVLG